MEKGERRKEKLVGGEAGMFFSTKKVFFKVSIGPCSLTHAWGRIFYCWISMRWEKEGRVEGNERDDFGRGEDDKRMGA